MIFFLNLYHLQCNIFRLPLNSDGSINTRLMPYVGNGHLATTIFSDSIFVNGLYNGKLGKRDEETIFFFHKIFDLLFFSNTILGDSHRARIPSIFAAEFSIGGCAPEEMIKTYRLETKRGKYK